MSYKRILVAVDGSKTSELALIEAIHLSHSLQSMLCIVCVVDAFPIANLAMGIDFDRYREIVRNDGLAILEKMSGIARKFNKNIETQLMEIIDAENRISEKLITAVEFYQADLLVLGTHGRRGFNRLILGSVAEETMRITPIPVLLVRAEEGTVKYYLQKKYVLYKKIIVAIDGSESSDLALMQAIYLAKILQANLHILHVANEFISKDFFFARNFIQYQDAIRNHGKETLETAKQCCQENSLSAEVELIEINQKSESVSGKIIEMINSLQADLLVIGTHGRSGINRFLLGSVAEETVRRAPVPVLLVRANDVE
jgi:nucleotide-binding universal stress UspA family protein